MIFKGTAIIHIAKLIYQRWKNEVQPIIKINAVAEPTPAAQDNITPNVAKPKVCEIKQIVINDAKNNSDRTKGSQFWTVR